MIWYENNDIRLVAITDQQTGKPNGYLRYTDNILRGYNESFLEAYKNINPYLTQIVEHHIQSYLRELDLFFIPVLSRIVLYYHDLDANFYF
jgi:hypothetical protein